MKRGPRRAGAVNDRTRSSWRMADDLGEDVNVFYPQKPVLAGEPVDLPA
jgi:hypothetical protein